MEAWDHGTVVDVDVVVGLTAELKWGESAWQQ